LNREAAPNLRFVFAIALVVAFAALVFGTAAARAAVGHPVVRTFSTGAGSEPRGVTTDAAGNVYTADVGARRIDKYTSIGSRVPFGATAGYVNEASLTGTGEHNFEFASWVGPILAVDNSGGADTGNIYVFSSDESFTGDDFAFASSGAYLGRIGERKPGSCGAAVNQANGEIFEGNIGDYKLRRFPLLTGSLAELKPNGEVNPFLGACGLAVDSTGAVWAAGYPFFETPKARKFTAAQFAPGTSPPVAESGTTPVAEAGTAPVAVAVDDSDNVYTDEGNKLVKFSPTGVQQGVAFGSLSNSKGVAVAPNGNVLATDNNGGVFVYGPAEVNLPKATTGAASALTKTSAEVAGTVDPDGAGTITGCEVRYGEDSGYSTGSVPCSPAAPISAAGPITANLGDLVSGVTYHYRVFVTNTNGTQMASEEQTFTTEAGAVESVATAAATEVKKDSAQLNGSFTGAGTETRYLFEWGATTAYGHVTAAPPGTSAGSPSGTFTVPAVVINGLHASTTYHYRLVATSPAGTSRSGDETFTTATAVTGLTTETPTQVTDATAELHGSFLGDSAYPTEYFYEWGPSLDYGNVTPASPGSLPAGSGKIDLPGAAISGLQRGSTYHFRIVATNATGTTATGDATFQAAEAPQVGNLNSRNLQATSAELIGEVNPRYGETTWYFEWGLTAGYGNRTPVGGAAAGAGNSPIPVAAQITELTSGATYHFRLVATNQYGTSVSPDQTFGFYPPNCPNAQLRQETRANSLPDCRAYELVSPSFAQGAIIFPLGGPPAPLATSPSKLAYSAAFGTFPEETGDPQNTLGDLYVSTRTDSGWYQKFIGLPITTTTLMGGPPRDHEENFIQWQFGPSRTQMGTQSDPSLSRIADYNLGNPTIFEQKAPNQPSNAPYIWNTSTGGFLERWPSNLGQIANGDKFVGIPEASPDFNHFVFQSNIVFADGGIGVGRTIGCCDGGGYPQVPPASIYDDNLQTGQVRLASVKADNKTTFEGYVYNISENGSHIVMAEERSTPATFYEPPGVNDLTDVKGPFYIRVDANRTYEIGAGHKLTFVGATSDGKTVYFRSAEQLSPEDTDQSTDLYAWNESEPNHLKLISLGSYGEAGDTDACGGITWNGGQCNIEVIDFIKYCGVKGKISEGFSGGQGGNCSSDQAIASKSGDIYFISPEALIAGKGEAGQANLYLWREGTLRLVAALNPKPVCTNLELSSSCSTGPVARMQVTPDGSRMAFVVTSQITGYNNVGKTEMYTYQPETGRIICASCRPDGQPPNGDVLASQNGLFQTYDGRVFFSTEDPLVPRDTNEVEDVYEYTEGRAQLITAGTGMVLKGFNGYTGLQTSTGLISVSANGTDVYFNSLDSLVTQDHNGAQFKIYDARTGGGFPAELAPEKCEAADECHGPGVQEPALPPDRTSSYLGDGNVKKAKAKKQKKKHHKKKHHKAAKKKGKQNAKKQGGKKHA
jgi:hypothetical protein